MATKGGWTRRDLPPISPDSRLLQDRRTAVKGRVPEPIRARTAQQTERLNCKTKSASLEIKDKLFNQFNKRLEDVQVERTRQNHYWRMKTKDSPYRYDQNEVDLRSAEAIHDMKVHRESRKKRLRRVKAMTGEPFMDFYTEKLKQSLGTQEKLAMEHFRLTEQLKVVRDEQATLEELLHQDCERIEMKFATVALQLAERRQLQRLNSNSNSYDNSNSYANDGNRGGKVVTRADSWSMVSQPKVSKERAREIKEQDVRLYQAEGRWNESGQFVAVKNEQDKVGLMSAQFALATGNKSSRNLALKKKDYGRLVEV